MSRKLTPVDPADVAGLVFARITVGKSGSIYPSFSFGREPSDLTSDRGSVNEADGKVLVASGLFSKSESGSIEYTLTPEGIREGIRRTPSYKPMDVRELLEDVLGTVLFGPHPAIDGKTAIPAIYQPGAEGSKLVLVLGENAAGKSLFRRVVNGATHRGVKARYDRDPEAIPQGRFPVQEFLGLSMQGRTSSGFASSCIYGEESYHSTGENSAHTLMGGLKNAAGRTHKCILYYDEPAVGMSARVAAGAGITLRNFIEKGDAPLVQVLFVTAHEPALIRQLAPLSPHYVHLGDESGPKTLADWLTAQENPEPVMPDDLKERARERFRLVQKVLNAK